MRDLNLPEIPLGASSAPRPTRTPSRDARPAFSSAGRDARQAAPSFAQPARPMRAERDRSASAPSRRRDDRASTRSGGSSEYRAIPGGRAGRPQRAGSDPRLTSVRIGDIGARPSAAGRRAQPATQGGGAGRLLAVLGVIVGVLLAAAIAFFALARSGVFEIRQISVQGVEHLTSTDVSMLVSVPAGTSLLDVDADGIRNRLLQDAWVKDVSVNRVFPDTLQIVVTERSIAAVVDIPTGTGQQVRQWAISSDGIWLMPIPARDSEAGQATSEQVYADAEQALHIEDVPYGTTPEIGAACTDANIENALAIVSGMTTELADQVTTVSATDPESTTLALSNGVEIAFGSATDIREKERVCLQLMSEHEGQIAYINVRVVERPTWRSL